MDAVDRFEILIDDSGESSFRQQVGLEFLSQK